MLAGIAVDQAVNAHYRVYYTEKAGELVVLLAGGDKTTQQRDILKAVELARNLAEN